LVQLSLIDNLIGDAGAAELSKALANNGTLAEVCCMHRTAQYH